MNAALSAPSGPSVASVLSHPSSVSVLSPITTGPLVHALFTSAEDTWNAIRTHRFVQELFAGNLDHTVLAHYLVQDYAFCHPFLGLLGAAIAYADTMSASLRFCEQAGFVAADENTYFMDRFQQFGLTQEQWQHPTYTAPTQAYITHMREAIASQSYVQVLITLTVAEWSYLDWARQADSYRHLTTAPEYVGWIDLHRGQDFTQWVQFLVNECEHAAQQVSFEDLTQQWRAAVELEVAFFDDAYNARVQ